MERIFIINPKTSYKELAKYSFSVPNEQAWTACKFAIEHSVKFFVEAVNHTTYKNHCSARRMDPETPYFDCTPLSTIPEFTWSRMAIPLKFLIQWS